ncbi:MAG: glycosyltransferase 87 family protein [Usitatibacter sp.]
MAARAMRWAGPAVALVLAAMVLAAELRSYPYQFGVDFYQIWGVPTAHRSIPASPYADPIGYARVLNAIADASDSAKLRNANRLYRDTLVPMATPLFDAAFAFVPESYDRARLAHTLLLFLAAGIGVFALARLRGIPRWPAAWVALAVELTFNPFLQDVRVGNANSLQLAFIAAMLYMAVKGLHARSARAAFAYVAALAVFVMFKPNVLWIALALAIHCALSRQRRGFALAAGAAACGALLAFAASAAYFNDVNVWRDWLECPQGMNRGVLPASFIPGNQSLPLALSRLSPAHGTTGYGAMVGAVLAMGFLLALYSAGHRGSRLASAAAACFRDPWFAASAGVVLTFGTSPMVWPHYHVFALVPIIWMLRLDRPANAATWGAAACYAVLSTPFIALAVDNGWISALDMLTLLSWAFLLPGLASFAGQPRGAAGPSP